MNKRMIAMLLASAVTAGTLAGCGGSNSSGGSSSGGSSSGGSSSGSSSSAGSSSSEKVKVTLIMALRDEWLSEMEAGAQNNCPDNVELTTQDAQNDAARQLQQIEAARNSGAQAIIINLVDPETAPQMKEAAGDCKVVFVNRYPSDDSVLDENCVYVGSDEMTSGAFQAEWIVDHFAAQGKTDISYVMLNGTLGQTSTTNRTLSVKQGMEAGGLNATEATAALACDFARDVAMDKFTPLIGSVDFDLVICNNDGMALGVIEALEQKGIDPATVPIVGIDASTDGRVAIAEGKLAMSVFQNPVGQGRGAIIAATNMVNGDNISADSGYETDDTGYVLWVPFEPVTIDNVADYN